MKVISLIPSDGGKSVGFVAHRMRLRFETGAALLLTMFSVTACGGGKSGPVQDQQMLQFLDTGRNAYELGYTGQALQAYQKAYQRALVSNDRQGLSSSGYNMAVVLLREHKSSMALTSVEQTKSDLAARGASSPAKLELVQAASFYQVGDYDRSARVACHLRTRNKDVALRAVFFCGVSAVGLHDYPEAARAMEKLASSGNHSLRFLADKATLQARLRFAQGHYAESIRAAATGAGLARQCDDYGLMRELLDLAAQNASLMKDLALARAYRQQSAQSRGAESATP